MKSPIKNSLIKNIKVYKYIYVYVYVYMYKYINTTVIYTHMHIYLSNISNNVAISLNPCEKSTISVF